MVRALPDEVEFIFEDPHAAQVEIRGCGPDGAECGWRMHREKDGTWRLRLRPGGGWFDFRYLVDGRYWALDGAIRTIVVAEDGGCRSRLAPCLVRSR